MFREFSKSGLDTLSRICHDPRMLTAPEVAALFRVTPATVYRWAKTGKLAAITVGGTVRFREDEVRRLLDAPASDGAA